MSLTTCHHVESSWGKYRLPEQDRPYFCAMKEKNFNGEETGEPSAKEKRNPTGKLVKIQKILSGGKAKQRGGPGSLFDFTMKGRGVGVYNRPTTKKKAHSPKTNLAVGNKSLASVLSWEETGPGGGL